MKVKNKQKVRLGKKGGLTRARSLSPQQRSDAARKAALVRWAKKDNAAQPVSKDKADALES